MRAADFAVTMVDIDQIGRHPKARQLNDDRLADLEESIDRIGLKNPIHVRRALDDNGSVLWDRYEIVSGHHRFSACRLLGWREVPCFVGVQDDVRAEMEMIAENLHRAELSKLERDEQVARWIELCGQKSDVDEDFEVFYAAVTENENESEHPAAAKPTHASQTETHRKAGQQPGGVNAAARDLGISKPDAHRAVKVASLSEEAKTVAREIGLDDNRTALLDAAKHDTPEAQVKALQDRKHGGIAGRVEQKPGPTYDELRSAILFLAELAPEDFPRLCPPNKRAAMCQKLAHLEQVFEQVREAVSA